MTQFPLAFKHYKPRSQRIYGIIAISKNDRILLVKGRERNKWSFPKGHIKPHETSHNCAVRECYEETGISLENRDYDDHRRLSSGSYYIYRNLDEEFPTIQDNNEIIDASWISIPGMMNLHTNVDVSKFLMVYKSIV
jgi:8-oxo-dGTP pyrophosphatase MutT (NUDIX family)